MYRILASVMSCAALMGGCDAVSMLKPKLSGADEILRVAEQIDSGQLEAAQKMIKEQPLPEIAHIDPSSPEFCTAAGIQTQMNNGANSIARDLLEHASADPLTRYAMAKRDIDARFEMHDGIFNEAGYCPLNQGELTLAYSNARRPIADAATQVLDRLKAKALPTVTGDFDAAVATVITDYTMAQRTRTRDDCGARRAAPLRTGVADDPLIARAEAQILQNCALQGF